MIVLCLFMNYEQPQTVVILEETENLKHRVCVWLQSSLFFSVVMLARPHVNARLSLSVYCVHAVDK